MSSHVITLHVHVEIPTNKYWYLKIVGTKGADKAKKLLDIICPVPECGVIVLAMPGHRDEARVDILEANPSGAVQLQHISQDHEEDDMENLP